MPTRNPTELGDHVMQNPANWFLSRELARRPPWEAQPLRIPGWDWALVSACLALVVAVWLGLAAPSSLIAAVLLALNLVLLTTCVFRAIRAGAPGLALMVLSCIIFFGLMHSCLLASPYRSRLREACRWARTASRLKKSRRVFSTVVFSRQ